MTLYLQKSGFPLFVVNSEKPSAGAKMRAHTLGLLQTVLQWP